MVIPCFCQAEQSTRSFSSDKAAEQAAHDREGSEDASNRTNDAINSALGTPKHGAKNATRVAKEAVDILFYRAEKSREQARSARDMIEFTVQELTDTGIVQAAI
ncbi:hypothetical protein A6U86_28170 [Rhizobium sp. AC27/96]|nr:hypothetical protein A6U86_28170 [Rhizobium sp. AC27/96]